MKYVVCAPAIGFPFEEIVGDARGQKVNFLFSVCRQLFDKMFLIDRDPSPAFLRIIKLHPVVKKYFHEYECSRIINGSPTSAEDGSSGSGVKYA
jgi:hypothetical protein